ncbi:unnamed protein product, partial [Iphiclides podalirius]
MSHVASLHQLHSQPTCGEPCYVGKPIIEIAVANRFGDIGRQAAAGGPDHEVTQSGCQSSAAGRSEYYDISTAVQKARGNHCTNFPKKPVMKNASGVEAARRRFT